MGSSIRYIIAVVLILFFAVFGTIFLVKQISRDTKTVKTALSTIHPADFSGNNNATIRWTQYGRLVGDDRRRAVRITISHNERKVELLTGYGEKVEKSITMPNDEKGYTDFLIALEKINFGQERSVKNNDDRGACPLGQTYVYEIYDGSDQKMRRWSDSCNAADGPFAGNAGTTRQLFKNQITGYDKFVAGIQF